MGNAFQYLPCRRSSDYRMWFVRFVRQVSSQRGVSGDCRIGLDVMKYVLRKVARTRVAAFRAQRELRHAINLCRAYTPKKFSHVASLRASEVNAPLTAAVA